VVRAQIVGATGYGGLGMVEQLSRHPEIELVSLLAKTDTGRPISDGFPHLRGICDMVVEEASPERIGEGADLVVFATPDRVGMEYAPGALARGAKVIDYSGDFRFGTPERYTLYSKLHPSTSGREHLAPELLRETVYGVPELYRERIKGARLVGNPGCFAVALILGLAPALRAGLIDPASLIVDGKTGSSGAGKKPGPVHHFPERNENLAAYRVANHQHSVEAATALSDVAGEPVKLTFVPHLVPMTRGIVCTAYADLREPTALEQAHQVYADAYAAEPFVRVFPPGQFPGVKSTFGSNYCDLSLAVDPLNDRLVVIASIDNLMKGQAGVALQNINLMCGFPEQTGLDRVPLYP
jgi:N-acetyl-gamma-glutamyl-phosphate reductase